MPEIATIQEDVAKEKVATMAVVEISGTSKHVMHAAAAIRDIFKVLN